jgi:hypothetical protein
MVYVCKWYVKYCTAYRNVLYKKNPWKNEELVRDRKHVQ